MGGASRALRAARFIEEFGPDAERRYGWPECPAVSAGRLDHEDDGIVRFRLTLSWNGREEHAVLDYDFFDAEAGDEETVSRAVDLLGLDEQEAFVRLRRADLVDPDLLRGRNRG